MRKALKSFALALVAIGVTVGIVYAATYDEDVAVINGHSLDVDGALTAGNISSDSTVATGGNITVTTINPEVRLVRSTATQVNGGIRQHSSTHTIYLDNNFHSDLAKIIIQVQGSSAAIDAMVFDADGNASTYGDLEIGGNQVLNGEMIFAGSGTSEVTDAGIRATDNGDVIVSLGDSLGIVVPPCLAVLKRHV